MVCDKVVCERWCETKLCVKDGVCVCDNVVCDREAAAGAGGGAGYRIKNKNPTHKDVGKNNPAL